MGIFELEVTFFCKNFWLRKKVCVILQPNQEQQNKVKTKKQSMIIVPVKDSNSIERALKQFKRKFEKTGINKELRRRQQFDKPSVKKRLAKEHAVYVTALRRNEE